MSSILLPHDGSDLAERAVPYAARLARSLSSRIVLLHIRPVYVAHLRPRFDLEPLAGALRREGHDVEVLQYDLHTGSVGDLIAEVAQNTSTAYVVMSTHGRGGIGRAMFGSVTDETIRKSEVPVLVVPTLATRRWPESGPARVLLPLDGSETAATAIEPAAAIAAAFGSTLLVARFVEHEPVSVASAGGFVQHVDLRPDSDLDHARGYVDRVCAAIRGRVRSVDAYVDNRFSTGSIASVADEESVDLIVMSTHGRGGLARMVMGSAAMATLARANAPVLVIGPRMIRAKHASAVTSPVAPPKRADVSLAFTLSAEERELVDEALRLLLVSTRREEHLAAPIGSLLRKLEAAEAGAKATAGAAG
jgi:nucleotide-binding universal stress UspA family protein